VSEPSKEDMAMKDAAEHVLHARMRIERAVDQGHLPAWVLDACERWEKAAMSYGAVLAMLATQKPPVVRPATGTVH
jgi:hypothetical protein